MKTYSEIYENFYTIQKKIVVEKFATYNKVDDLLGDLAKASKKNSNLDIAIPKQINSVQDMEFVIDAIKKLNIQIEFSRLKVLIRETSGLDPTFGKQINDIKFDISIKSENIKLKNLELEVEDLNLKIKANENAIVSNNNKIKELQEKINKKNLFVDINKKGKKVGDDDPLNKQIKKLESDNKKIELENKKSNQDIETKNKQIDDINSKKSNTETDTGNNRNADEAKKKKTDDADSEKTEAEKKAEAESKKTKDEKKADAEKQKKKTDEEIDSEYKKKKDVEIEAESNKKFNWKKAKTRLKYFGAAFLVTGVMTKLLYVQIDDALSKRKSKNKKKIIMER